MGSYIKHLGIIMDGNRRWARARGLPVFEGHRAGYKKTREVLEWCRDAGIQVLTLFCFSTENWKRDKKEVEFLMKLFYLTFSKDAKKLHKHGVRVRVIGSRAGLSEKLQKAIAAAEKLTERNTAGTLNLAINYGGRTELSDAFEKIMKNPPKKVTPEVISENLYTAGQPDPDLIIRTSGEWRLSGFLLWQSAYSELLFMEKFWPDFTKKDFEAAVSEFAGRKRRFGK